jgi:hypothetical protein
VTTSTAGVVAVTRALGSAFRFVYDHGFSLILVSFAWTLASLPVVTLGPATVGVYAAVASLREKGWVDRREVFAAVRGSATGAVSLTLVVTLLGVMAVLYALQFLANGSMLAGGLAIGAGYATAHLALMSPAVLLGLARGDSFNDALGTGYRWTVEHPLTAVLMAGWTVLLLVLSVALTIAVVLVFPAIAFTFHTLLLDDVVSTGTDRDDSPPGTRTRAAVEGEEGDELGYEPVRGDGRRS